VALMRHEKKIVAERTVHDLISDLETIADWKEDLNTRLRRAELCFQTIGLSDERREELIHEANCFNRVCQFLAEERFNGID
jgi:hypothetical protein